WEKVLWRSQEYPDNHIPDSFLSSLRKNANFRPYTYWSLVLGSCPITQHLATIFIFLAVFVQLRQRTLDPRLLVWISIGGFIAGYMVWEWLDYRQTVRSHQQTNRAKIVKSSILVFLALMALSPVLKTLSAATSSDSIWALSACLFTLNVVFADYSSVRLGAEIRERLTSVLSMNAAISASVVLASRLSDDLSVFSLVLFSVQLFALFPLLRHRLQAMPSVVSAVFAMFLSALSIYLSSALSTTVTFIFIYVFVFVTFIAPGMLVWSQKYKNEIRGPWDVAVPKLN
ncbi:hypothetical protein JAAARDRAFT_115488, partial [Jaapia argillacea MUCL 33604]